MESTEFTTYTRNEVGEMLRISLSTVGNLITSGDLYAVRVGSVYRVPHYALQDFIHGKPPRHRRTDPLTSDDASLPPTDSLLAEGADN